MTDTSNAFSGAAKGMDFISSARWPGTTPEHGGEGSRLPEGLALLRPIYGMACLLAAGASFVYAGVEGASIAVAMLLAIWAFIEPRATLWLTTAYMVLLFIFFQSTAPLGEEVPEEFFYWGIGVALITAGMLAAVFFTEAVEWADARRRARARTSLAMWAMTLVILAATVYGLFAGNSVFAVTRQFFGCLLLPVFYFLAMVLFRTPADTEIWLRRVCWVVACGSVWYVARLSLISFAHGGYYREQSPLVAYCGAIAVAAWMQLISRRRTTVWLQALALLLVCVAAILMMGSRSTLGSVIAAVVALSLLALRKRGVLLMALALCVLSVTVGIAPYVSASLAQGRGLAGYVAGRFIFVLSEDPSYQGRVAQGQVVMSMVEKSPILGAGMGSENSFIVPGLGYRVKVASVDNGWGFLLLKMGYLGLAAFLALVGLLLRRAFRGIELAQNPAFRAQCLAFGGILVYALINFLGGPVFFHFSVAPFFATALGALLVLGEARDAAAAAVQKLPARAERPRRIRHA